MDVTLSLLHPNILNWMQLLVKYWFAVFMLKMTLQVDLWPGNVLKGHREWAALHNRQLTLCFVRGFTKVTLPFVSLCPLQVRQAVGKDGGDALRRDQGRREAGQ